MRRPLWLVFLLFIPLPLTAQEEEAAQEELLPVQEVQVEPSEAVLRAGEQMTFTAVALDSAGNVLSDVPIRWSASPFDVVTVDSTGAVTAGLRGRAAVVARYGQVIGRAWVTVEPRPVERLEVKIPEATFYEGVAVPVEVQAFDGKGFPRFDPPLTWFSADPRVAEFQSGYLVAKRVGKVSVSVSADQARKEIAIEVMPSPVARIVIQANRAEARTGDVVHLKAVGVDRKGREVGQVWPRWFVDHPGLEISPDGAVVAEEPGTYTILGRVGDIVAQVPFTFTSRGIKGRFEVVGKALISSTHTSDLWVFDGVAYLGSWGGREGSTPRGNQLRVFDISDPKNPVQTDSVVVDARTVNDVKVNAAGTIAVITREGASDRKNGIVILDTSDPKHPKVISEYTETLSGGVHNVFIDSDYVYAVHNGTNALHVIEIADPANPAEVARWEVERPGKNLHDVFVLDGLAYVSYWDDGLVILDVGNGLRGGSPERPQFVSQIAYPEGNTHTAFRYEDYVFVGDEIFPPDWSPQAPIDPRGFIHVIDVRDIEHPREVARYEVPEAGSHNVWVEDDILYVAYYQGGLRAVDISGELRGDLYRQGREYGYYLTLGTEESFLPNAAMTWGPQLYQGMLFASDFNSGLWITRLIREEAGGQPVAGGTEE